MGNRESAEAFRPELSTVWLGDADVKGMVWVCYRRGLTRPQAVERCRVLGLGRATWEFVDDAYAELDMAAREAKNDWSLLLN